MSNQTSVKTLIEHFYYWEQHAPERVFLRQPFGKQWRTFTFAQAGQQARSIAAALNEKGLKVGDHVGILSKNCYHWILADLAIMMGGFVSVPYYASLPARQLKEVVALSNLKALFLGKLDEWNAEKTAALPTDLSVIRFPHYEGNAEIALGEDWDDLVAQNTPLSNGNIPALTDLWTILFTSGTTGTPKGAMHLHRSPATIMQHELETNRIGLLSVDEVRCFSYLPLNHVAERIAIESVALVRGGLISFAENINTFADNLRATQPTIFFGVPRIWNKIHQGVTAKIAGRTLERLLALPLVGGWIKSKILHAMGMSRVQVAGTGAAITPARTKAFFKLLGIHLIEAYGMTEVCGMIANGPVSDTPLDSVGTVIPYGNIRIDESTGEVLMQTPYMMTGYYQDAERTAAVLRNGWLHSGDRGTIDAVGFLRITGRIGDAFKTAKGKYVVPNPLEEALTENDYLSQVCVVGLGQPQPLALAQLSELGEDSPQEEVTVSLEKTLQQVNAQQANFERIAALVVVKTPWTQEAGFLTPTLKVRRTAIDDHYGDRYTNWLSLKEFVIWIS